MDLYIILTRLIETANVIAEKIKEEPGFEEYTEHLVEVKNLGMLIFNKLDPSLRLKLMKRGVSLLLNTNAGYDTEYVEDEDKAMNNIQVSAQLAVSSHIVLRIPLNILYEYEGVETLRGSVYKLKNESKCLDYDKILNDLRYRLERLRGIKYGISDFCLNEIVKYLKEKEIPYSESLESGFVSFSFPRSTIKT